MAEGENQRRAPAAAGTCPPPAGPSPSPPPPRAAPRPRQGAATVRQLMPEVVTIFLAAESEAALAARLVGRATEPLDKLVTRVQTAREVRRGRLGGACRI
jgi:hypothetical protein